MSQMSEAKITTIQDGLLVTGRQKITSNVAEYTILVTLAPPQPPNDLQSAVSKLEAYIKEITEQKLIDADDTHGWSQHIRMLKTALTSLMDRKDASRPKRAIFDFVGSLSHILFGTATDKSVEEC